MSALEEFEHQAFSDMLALGQLPCPLSQEDDEALQKAGIRLRGHGLLLKATLPPGWQAIQTGNRHGQLIDDQGRVRAELFYKDELHQARGHLQMQRRFTISERPDGVGWCAWDIATQTVLFEDSSVPSDEQLESAREWLNENYPNWLSPVAYWSEEDGSADDAPWWKFWA